MAVTHASSAIRFIKSGSVFGKIWGMSAIYLRRSIALTLQFFNFWNLQRPFGSYVFVQLPELLPPINDS